MTPSLHSWKYYQVAVTIPADKTGPRLERYVAPNARTSSGKASWLWHQHQLPYDLLSAISLYPDGCVTLIFGQIFWHVNIDVKDWGGLTLYNDVRTGTDKEACILIRACFSSLEQIVDYLCFVVGKNTRVIVASREHGAMICVGICSQEMTPYLCDALITLYNTSKGYCASLSETEPRIT